MEERTITIDLTQREFYVFRQILRNYLSLMNEAAFIHGSKLGDLCSKFLVDNGD